MYIHRESELEQYKQIWLTKEAYDYLREKKKKEKISMAKILDNILKENMNNLINKYKQDD